MKNTTKELKNTPRKSGTTAKKDKTLKYEGLELPENLNYILDQDFWLLDNITGVTLAMLHSPMKFTSTTSIFVRRGHCKAEINLEEYEIEAPCVVNIASSEIMQPLKISDDFEGAFVVMSQRFISDFISMVNDENLISKFKRSPIMTVAPQYLSDFEMLYRNLRSITSESNGQYSYQTVLHTLLAFFYNIGLKCLKPDYESGSTAAHITNRFLKMARENFKKERFMDFYASQLEITPKHLGRTIKAQTGFTASEWLDRMVILEAKVLLKSTSMTIQQIAEELNFTSQSFFGKYFKNIVGVSPKEFRNS